MGASSRTSFVLEQNGFHFVRHDTKVEDFFDEEELRRVYYSEMEALVKAEIGASRVVVFDHTLRTADDELRQDARSARSYAVYIMITPSGPLRNAYATSCQQEADGLLRRRFAIVQVWRPIRHPVETFPLAICDARTLSDDDLIVSERRYPNWVGQTYAITYNPAHRWYWFPRMRRDEALVFKVYDSLNRWPSALDGAYGIRRPELAAQCAAAREYRDTHPRILLKQASAPHDRFRAAQADRRDDE